MELTERDRAIIRLIYRHRFLRSSHIVSLMGGSRQQILRRLQLMYHHGFLDRPRIQIEYYYQGGSRQIVYGLGKKGRSLLKQEANTESPSFQFEGNISLPHRVFFEHAVLVSDIMVAIELACRKVQGVHLLMGEELPLAGGVHRKLKWRVKVNRRVLPYIIPDRVFALIFKESPDQSPGLFFLEADRGTMPIVRQNLSQSSFYRKLLAYESTWTQGLHRTRFGYHRFRVLTVTTSAARAESLVAACSQLKSGHGLFLFADQAALKRHGDILTFSWKTGRGETAKILP